MHRRIAVAAFVRFAVRSITAVLLLMLAMSAFAADLPKADPAPQTLVTLGASSKPYGFAELGGYAYFFATTAGEGQELWRTDGTEAGTTMVKAIRPDVISGHEGNSAPVVFNGALYFAASDNGVAQLWRSDGTEAGTVKIRELPAGASVQVLQPAGNLLYMVVTFGVSYGCEVWRSDGTAAGTFSVKASQWNSFRYSVPLGNLWLFMLGSEVWRTDGTAAGTIMLAASAANAQPAATPTHAYFVGTLGYSGLWRTDGTTYEQVETSEINRVAVLADRVYYVAGATKLFSTTGAVGAGTLVHDFSSDYTRSGYTCSNSVCGIISGLQPASDRVYVFAGTSYYVATGGPATSGSFDVWKTTGTEAGTEKLATISTDAIYTPGSTALTIGTRLYTLGYTRPTGAELWTSDGTVAGTFMVKDIAADADATGAGYTSGAGEFGAFGSKLLFRANDRLHGHELWQSDGTTANTTMVRNINPEGSIRGRVYDASTDEPVTSALVSIYAKDTSGTAFWIRSFDVDANGNYQIDGLPTLTYYLFVTNSENYAGQNWNGRDCFPCSITGDGVFIASTETVSNIDFPLNKGGAISGHVSLQSDGTPIAGLKVTVAKQYGATGTTVVTDDNGDYATQTGLPAGTYAVYTDATVYSGQIWNKVGCAAGCTAASSFTGVTVSGTETVSGIDFSLVPLGVIAGTITDAVTGEPMRDVLVSAFSRDKEMGTANGLQPAASVYTTSDGTYTLTLPDGTYSLLFRANAYTSEFWPDTSCSTCTTHAGTAIVPVPGATTTYDATLQPTGGRVRGSVTDAVTNAPILNLRMYLYNASGQQVATTSTVSGAFAFPPNLGSGTYYLRTDPTVSSSTVYMPDLWDGVNGTPCNNCNVTSGAKLVITGTNVIDNVNLTLDKFGTIHAKLYDATTLQAVVGEIVLNASDGLEVGDMWNTSEHTFTHVWPGTYFMHTEALSGYPNVYYGGAMWCWSCPGAGATPITVPANIETTVNFALQKWGQVTGRLTDASGQGVFGTVEIWMPGGTAATNNTYADRSGNYSIQAYGDVIVKASKDGYATKTHNGAECPNCYDIPPLTVNGGSTVTVNFVMTPAAHISGTVTDAIGAVPGSISIIVYDSRGNAVRTAYASYGTFDIATGAGTYYLHTTARWDSASGTGYVPATYKAQNCNTFCQDKALAVTVASGGTVTVAMPLTGTAKITGTVTNANTSAAIANVPLVVWDLIGNKLALNVTTGSDGKFSAAVPICKYAVYTNSATYTNQVWNGVTCNGACTPGSGTTILARNVYPAVDFALKPKPPAVRDSYGDFNADGKSEIIWRSGTGVFTMWEMNGRTIATTQTITTLADANWKVLGFGDFDGDGDDDFFFRNSVSGGTAMWLMNGKTITLNAASTTVADMKWQMQAIGDFNKDGKDELIWRNMTTGAVAMWEVNGVTLLNGNIFATVSDLNWEIVTAADFTGDGRDEILWRNKSNGKLAMWELNGRTQLNTNVFATVSDLTWSIVAAGDYNGDGKADLLWRQSGTNMIAMWEMNGRTLIDGRSLITVPSNWVVEHCGDFNADKKDEILWRNTTTGAVAMWETSGHTLNNTATFTTVSDLNTKMQPKAGL